MVELAIKILLDSKRVAKYPRKPEVLRSIEVPRCVDKIYRLANTLKIYAADLGVYERLYQEAVALDLSYTQGNADIDCQVEELIWDESGLTELDISIVQKQKIWSKAWSDGHAHGYYEIYNKLCDLVEIFK